MPRTKNRDYLPSKEAEWHHRVAEFQLTGETIHNAKLKSASTIDETQYLLLRVLWIESAAFQLDLNRFELADWKKKADSLLGGFASWHNYRQSFSGTPIDIPEGTFAVARKYQLQAAQATDKILRPSVELSPRQTRSMTARLARQLAQAHLETPTKSTGNPKYPRDDDSEIDEDSGDEEEEEEEETPFYSPGAGEIRTLMYPQTKDEQIVNIALVDFLNALTMHFRSANDWSIHRVAFKATFTHASFEARTDGYLEDSKKDGKARALIEVKPMIRADKIKPIRMQEAAQMAAWIKYDQDINGSLNKRGRCVIFPPFVQISPGHTADKMQSSSHIPKSPSDIYHLCRIRC
ncbi:hypothetical protein NUU61_009725 [Penicillium alfredii]|uniref:Uncharacterized protein n=1 Tax=Penicillium alfredii TaxID=1506179 RepID=A0A9W9EGR8_9EURO|nr:uncharacterized protein NUU61_009725 [Penicillium alfredii]KAJ5081461.1 hypothetical protein NUU61_009725 [Penicillium alfredii]